MTGSWLFTFRIFKSNSYDLIHGIGIDDLFASLGNRSKKFYQIQILMRGQMHPLCSHLSGNGNQRRSVGICIRGTGDQVRCSGSQCGKAHTCLPRKSSVHVRHECSTLFMSYHNDPDVRLLQCIHHIQILFSRDTEDIFYAFVFQTFHQHLSYGILLLFLLAHRFHLVVFITFLIFIK